MSKLTGNCVVKKMKLTQLKTAEYNPREITNEAFKGLGGSIERFGLVVPIVYNKRTGNVVGGHQRYKYLVEQGESETDVVVVDLDGNEEIALNITLNNPNVRGKFTNEVVDLLKLSEGQLGDAFKDVGLNKLLETMKVDEVKPQPKGSSSKGSGDYDGEPSERFKDKEKPAQPQALIVCPRCKSKWRMQDNVVVEKNAAGGE